MVPIQLLVPFLASELHMAGILHNNNVSLVQVRDVVRLVLALHRELQGAQAMAQKGQTCLCYRLAWSSTAMREARRPTTCSLASTSLSCRPAVSMPCTSAEACCRSHGSKACEAISLLTLSSFLDIPLHTTALATTCCVCKGRWSKTLRRSKLLCQEAIEGRSRPDHGNSE